jgi:hypothetical protein
MYSYSGKVVTAQHLYAVKFVGFYLTGVVGELMLEIILVIVAILNL